jgi:type IV pilus assembly protein PilF
MTARSLRAASLLLIGVAALALIACVSTTSGDKRKKQKGDASNYNMQLGMAYLNQGDLGLAKEKLDRALAENPGDPNVHSAMAMLQDRLGHPDLADKEFKAALSLGPRSPDVLNNYAVYLCRTGRTDEGVKSFEEAAHNALYRTPEAAYTNAGVCLRGAKRDTQAAMSFQRALQVKPNFAEAAYQLADLDFERGELPDARETIDRFISSFDATPDLLLLGVRITRQQGDRLAEERFARKLRLDFPASDQARALAELNHNPG